jgi:hypothetical protein
MNGKQISLIYFYLVSIFSLVLLVIGIYNVATFLINTTQYSDYPLRYQQADCDVNPYQFKVPAPYSVPESNPQATPNPAEQNTIKQSCEKQLALMRKQQQLDVLKSAVVFSGAGLVLFLIHFTQARKHSK